FDAQADLCNGICQFPLCVLANTKPTIQSCAPEQANFVVRLQSQLAGSGRRGTRVKVGGTTVRLMCHENRTGPCLDICTTDSECEVANGQLSRCVSGGHCLATPACP